MLTSFEIVSIARVLRFVYAIVMPFGRSCVDLEKLASTISDRTRGLAYTTPFDVRTSCRF